MFYVSDYLSYFRQQSYPHLFSDECITGMQNIEAEYGNRISPKVIYEVRLGSTENITDFSIQLLTSDNMVKNYWLEFDFDEYQKDGAGIPCVFYDASSFLPKKELWVNYHDRIYQYIGKDRSVCLENQLKKSVLLLEGRCPSLFQIGTMNSRQENRSVRIYTTDMNRLHISEYLKEMSWSGDYQLINHWMKRLEQIRGDKGFSVSFDVYPSHISSKIGLEFTVRTSQPDYKKKIAQMIDLLIKDNICLENKGIEILNWLEAKPYKVEDRYIRNMITHIKIQFNNDKFLGIKCYLGQAEKK